ncbi:MAG: GNAT family N-acetyltransferase [Ekhidna sp.]
MVEAKLLNAKDFPPLKRSIEDLLNAESEFYGYHDGTTIVAVLEVKSEEEVTHIQSLVVDPQFFRKGIASKLLDFLFTSFESSLFTVETGAENKPAIALYERFGFEKVQQWMTEVGIEKVRFSLKPN